MTMRAVLVAAVLTGLILGIAGARAERPAPPRQSGASADSGR
ncbi:hypothetical protein ACX6XY_26185 [Streptomyces sp. O3]